MSKRLMTVLTLLIPVIVAIGWKVYQPRQPQCRDCTVIVISLDQVRAESLPCFGYTKESMPNLCAFAGRSAVFTQAYATASRTMDAHFSMMTGLYPSAHTMNLPYASELPSSVQTMAEALKQDGYTTAFFGPKGDPHLPLTKGMERGFDRVYTADTPLSWIASMDAFASESAGLKHKQFYFLHTYDAHEPWVPSDESFRRFYTGSSAVGISYDSICEYTYRTLKQLHPDRIFPEDMTKSYCERIDSYTQMYSGTSADYDDTYSIFNTRYWELFDGLAPEDKKEYVHALYLGRLYELDTDLKIFLDYLGKRRMLNTSIIAVVGDQGDEFGEHGGWSHGGTLYNEVLHVPMIFSVPGIKPERNEKLASQVDILPTILALLGIPQKHQISGMDLFSGRSHVNVISEHVSDKTFSVRTKQYTYIQRGNGEKTAGELYDRIVDPHELSNIIASYGDVSESLLDMYKAERNTAKTISDMPLPTWMNGQDRKELIESGYF